MKDKNFQTSDGVTLHYTDRGTGEPCIFLHGIFQQRYQLSALADRVAKKSFSRCITIDLRGHGLSRTTSVCTSKRYAEDLNELLNHIGASRAAVVGNSFGGYILLDYIRQYGQERLSALGLFDITPKMLSDSDWSLGFLRGKYRREQWQRDLRRIDNKYGDFIAYFIYRSITVPPKGGYRERAPAWAYTARPLIAHDSEIDKGNLKALWKEFEHADFRDLLPQLEMPTLIVGAVPGSFFLPEASAEMARMIGANARYIRIGGAGREAVSHHALPSHRRELADEIVRLLGEARQ